MQKVSPFVKLGQQQSRVETSITSASASSSFYLSHVIVVIIILNKISIIPIITINGGHPSLTHASVVRFLSKAESWDAISPYLWKLLSPPIEILEIPFWRQVLLSLSLSRSRPRPEKYCSAERIYDKEEAFLCLHCTAHTLECKRLKSETHWRVQHIWLYQFEWAAVHLVEAQFYATQRQQGGSGVDWRCVLQCVYDNLSHNLSERFLLVIRISPIRFSLIRISPIRISPILSVISQKHSPGEIFWSGGKYSPSRAGGTMWHITWTDTRNIFCLKSK